MADILCLRDRFRGLLVYKSPQKTLTIGAAETTDTLSLLANGFVRAYTLVIPNWTNVVTLTLTITDKDSFPIYTSSAFARNTNQAVTDLEFPVWGDNTITCTLSGVPGGSGGNILFSIYLV